VLLVAHRTPPTRAGCEQLAAAGARVFEADVQLGADGQAVVSHFLPFGRFLQRDNWRLRWRAGAVRDPQLRHLAALVPQACLVLVDLKETRPARRAALVHALDGTLTPRERFRVCGGRPPDLDALRARGVRTWRTVGNRAELRAVLAADRLPDEALSVRHSLLSARVLTALHERVDTVVAWTVNDVGRARELRGLGVDGVTTDRREILRELAGHS
jgi:glycerophosphoryl diester phosphodiesterase